MSFLDPIINKKVKDNLASLEDNEELFNRFTVLQNEISVSFPAKITAVTSIKDDSLAASFAKAYASTYAHNGFKALLIDANLYNPCLEELLGNVEAEVINDKEESSYKTVALNDKVSAICMNKNTYPSNVYKAGVVQKLVEDNKEEFAHIIILVPSIKEHKEVVLLKEVVDSIILVTQKNVTKKGHIYNAGVFAQEASLPLAKVVVLK